MVNTRIILLGKLAMTVSDYPNVFSHPETKMSLMSIEDVIMYNVLCQYKNYLGLGW